MFERVVLDRVFLGNTVEDYLWCAGILLIGILFRHLLSKLIAYLAYHVIGKVSKKEKLGFGKFSELLKRPFASFITIVTIYIGFSHLNFPPTWKLAPENVWGLRMFLLRVSHSAIVITFTWIVLRLVDFIGLLFMVRALQTESKSDDQIVPFVKEAVKVVIVIISIFSILGAIFTLDITSLIAGLGIGGIAVALAAKESLENLLGSFTIFFDKPFLVGDLIKVGNIEGNVEKIGFRSTRIRTLEKTFLTVPNKKLVDTELDNLTKLELRRVKFYIGLLYGTSIEEIQKIVTEIKTMIEQNPNVREEVSVYFMDFGAYSLNVRIIYFLSPPDWKQSMEEKEKINFKIMEIVLKNGSDFAFPTSTVIHENEKTEIPKTDTEILK